MTSFEIEEVRFDAQAVRQWSERSPRNSNWPVVYLIDDGGSTRRRDGLEDIYVGESLNGSGRFLQHLANPSKQHLKTVRVVMDETFNKSACLDLESFLIRLLAGDGKYRVLNRNDGITDADYYRRAEYQEVFDAVFARLKAERLFTRDIAQIENSDLFKLSPFKALNRDQAVAVEDILEGLFDDLESGASSTIAIQGDPGTGKTVVGIFMVKLLVDIAAWSSDEVVDGDTLFVEFFTEDHRAMAKGLRIGLVVPQQSLRQSIAKVFRKTPGLDAAMVLTPFEVGESPEEFDLLIVDETHRLNHRANQPSGVQNKRFTEINERLFGSDDKTKTQLDWIVAQSKHQIFLVDAAQSVRPADLPKAVLEALIGGARASSRYYPLTSQMRVQAGFDYIGYIRQILRPEAGAERVRPALADFDMRLFDDVGAMRDAIQARDEEVGLSRMVAGYAWEWVSRKNPALYDIELDGVGLRWNSTDRDWINAPGSLNEVGSIHTVQGYDLNYVGVIIGPELRFDAERQALFIDRASYADKKGKENNPTLGLVYTDDDLLEYIRNIYGVLLTRGIRGTYVYVCDPALREYIRSVLPARR